MFGRLNLLRAGTIHVLLCWVFQGGLYDQLDANFRSPLSLHPGSWREVEGARQGWAPDS